MDISGKTMLCVRIPKFLRRRLDSVSRENRITLTDFVVQTLEIAVETEECRLAERGVVADQLEA